MENFSRISWTGLTPSTRTDKVKQVTFNDIQLTRSPAGFSFEGPNLYTERILTLETSAPRILPYKNKMHNAVTYEVNHKRVMIQRIDYSLF